MQIDIWQEKEGWRWRTSDGTQGKGGFATPDQAAKDSLESHPGARTTVHFGTAPSMTPIAKAIDQLRSTAWKAYEAHSHIARAKHLGDEALERQWRQRATEREAELKDAWQTVEALL